MQYVNNKCCGYTASRQLQDNGLALIIIMMFCMVMFVCLLVSCGFVCLATVVVFGLLLLKCSSTIILC